MIKTDLSISLIELTLPRPAGCRALPSSPQLSRPVSGQDTNRHAHKLFLLLLIRNQIP
jgi:hypothetical protein